MEEHGSYIVFVGCGKFSQRTCLNELSVEMRMF